MEKRRSEADRRARQSQRLARVLRVLGLIQERRGWDLESLARELDCSKRTIQRDLDVLEACGVPWYYDERRCCYRVRPGFRMPLLNPPTEEQSRERVREDHESPDAPPTAEELADLSRDSAERLLDEAERLVKTLARLCQTLRRSGQSPPGKGAERAK
ncbi:HTH domain-containing protein [Paludisphaera sp.]|uniref:HTH domain-containing protein n=1 Tax=Paludisphaera sp. TaxID=2017432 RepID=UPI00301E4750